MARSDLLLALVKAGAVGDRRGVRVAAEAIIAEERQKQHTVLADRLASAILSNGNGSPTHLHVTEGLHRGRDFLAEVTPKRRLDELVLSTETRRSIDELIEEQFRADLLRANGLEPRHRVLLTGPPGTGKTTLAEGIASAVSVPMFVVRYESMIGSYLGETATRLKRVFDYARTTPCVLFFDEFDTIGKERGDVHETGEIKRVVSSLLVQIDELPSYTIVLAATNHPELLDRATWRRFQLRLTMPMPSRLAIASYLENFSSVFGEPLGHSPTSIAKSLGAVSFAEVESFCLDLRRRQVLAMGQRPMREIVSEQLKLRARQARSTAQPSNGGNDGGTANSDTSKP